MSRPFSSENVFRALAHRVRRQAVEELARRDVRPSELHGLLQCSITSLSQHLRVLRQSGLVAAQRKGTSLVYRLDRDLLKKAANWMARQSSATSSK